MSLTISNSIIRNNLLKADYTGGNIGASAPGAFAFGAGISAVAAEVVIENSVISGNEAIADITNLRSLQIEEGHDVRGIAPALKGGGISASVFGQLTVTRSLIHGNTARIVAALVGADGNDNTVSIEGAGIHSTEQIQTLIDDITISDNSGVYDLRFLPGTRWLHMYSQGGGAWIGNGAITNSTISGNSLNTIIHDDENFTVGATEGVKVMAWGAGLYSFGTVISHTTIADNQIINETDNMDIAGAGAGLWTNGSAFGPPTIYHAVLADNSIVHFFRRDPNTSNDDELFTTPQDLSTRSVGFAGPPPPPAETTAVYSLIETNDAAFSVASGNNIFGQDAKLGLLAHNDGFALPDGSTIQTHKLLPGSPAINAGDPGLVAGVGDTPAFDQRGSGFSRVSPPGGVIDIGAFEVGPADLVSADFDVDGDVDGRDLLIWQRGLGSINAGPEDGDADNDQDVDGDDLTVWRNTFGAGAMVAIATAQSRDNVPSTGELLYQLVGLALPQLGIKARPVRTMPPQPMVFEPTPPQHGFHASTISVLATPRIEGEEASLIDEDRMPELLEVDEVFAQL